MIYHILFKNGHIMMDSNEDQNYICVYFLSESISIVNVYLRVYYKDPNEKFLVNFLA